jgi:uncharacterized OB-fold protein
MVITETEATGVDAMAAQICMPYTLTPGRAVGIFLAELANRRLIGSRHGDEILVPAQDYSGSDGEPADSLCELEPAGELVAYTTTRDGTYGLILIDGTTQPMLHRLVNLAVDPDAVGRVRAVWANHRSGSILDIEGFEPDGIGTVTEPREATDLAAPLEQIDYSMQLDYDHAYGHYYGTLFDGVRHGRRLRGVKCPSCQRVLLPARPNCEICFVPTNEWVDVADTGVVQASSIVHLEFIGQRRKPPYVYAEIILDGASTRLIHTISDVDPEAAKTLAAPGARVRAVWSERSTGSLEDIDYFELIRDDSDRVT